MVTRIKFENNSRQELEICVEPFANYIDWEKDKPMEIELNLTTEEFNDELVLALTGNSLVIYEGRQYEMKVFVGEELKYSTPPGRYV
jgi:hypothetical protein